MANNSALEDAVYIWYLQKSFSEPISGPLICEKTLQVNKKLYGVADLNNNKKMLFFRYHI